MSTTPVPSNLLPQDGRFGSGPSKVRQHQADSVASSWATLLGTSHRQPPIKHLVGQIRSGLTDLYSLPEGYEIALGNGGATAFWDMASFCLVGDRVQHAVMGEFSGKFSRATQAAPFIKHSEAITSTPGELARCRTEPGFDTYAYAHNETSTGVLAPLERFGDNLGDDGEGGAPGALTLVDATSIAGALECDLSLTDAYYFSPQKAFASDGGLWLAILSPAAIERCERLVSERWVPDFLNLKTAVDNSRKNQTYNTPAIATLIMLAEQIEWMRELGGLGAVEARCRESSGVLYEWAQAREWASPFVGEPAHRSPVVATIDLDPKIDAGELIKALRDNGILDVFPYRSLGRNQLRVGTFPAVSPSDARALTECIDFLVQGLAKP